MEAIRPLEKDLPVCHFLEKKSNTIKGNKKRKGTNEYTTKAPTPAKRNEMVAAGFFHSYRPLIFIRVIFTLCTYRARDEGERENERVCV